MPHFIEVKEDEHQHYLERVHETLINKFLHNHKVHRDVRWRNIGLYSNVGDIVVIVFDLHNVDDEKKDYLNWIDKAIQHLTAIYEVN